jgi:hypothetical protein
MQAHLAVSAQSNLVGVVILVFLVIVAIKVVGRVTSALASLAVLFLLVAVIAPVQTRHFVAAFWPLASEVVDRVLYGLGIS